MSGKPLSKFQLQEIKKIGTLVYNLDPSYPGKILPMYSEEQVVMSVALLAALKEAGVKNLEIFPAKVIDIGGKAHKDYKAVNIVGLVACAKEPPSKVVEGISVQPGSRDIDTFYGELYIDEKKADKAKLLMFRLKESVNAIVVHEKVRQKIEEKKIPGMEFYGPGEWAG